MESKVKSFNFALVGITVGVSIDGSVKPIAPFYKKSQRAAYSDFINCNDGKVMNGTQYWKKMNSIFFGYLEHDESYFEGNKGILFRRHLNVSSIINMGKESNNLEESELELIRTNVFD
jgi:hypothetical protein